MTLDETMRALPSRNEQLHDYLVTAQARIAELTKTIDAKNRLIDHWRLDCEAQADARVTAEKRIAELEAALIHSRGWIEALPFASNVSIAKGVTHTLMRIDAALAGSAPATRGE